MRSRDSLVLLSMASLLLTRVACGQIQIPPPAELLALNQESATRSGVSGLSAGLAPVLDTGAVLVYPGAPVVHSRGAILALLNDQPAASTRIQWDAVFAELSVDSSFAVMYGTTVRLSVRRDTAADAGRFESAWRRRADGSWKIVALCFAAVPKASEIVLQKSGGVTDVSLPPLPRTDRFARADYEFSDRAGIAGVAAAFGEFAAPDASTFGGRPGPFTRGPGNIRHAMELSGAGSSRWKWWPVFATGDPAGNLGATVGEAEIRWTGEDGKDEVFYSAYLTLWRRMPDGSIRFIADAGGQRPAPAR